MWRSFGQRSELERLEARKTIFHFWSFIFMSKQFLSIGIQGLTFYFMSHIYTAGPSGPSKTSTQFTDSYLIVKDAEFGLKGPTVHWAFVYGIIWILILLDFPRRGSVDQVWSLSHPVVKQCTSGPHLIILVNGNIGTSKHTHGNKKIETPPSSPSPVGCERGFHWFQSSSVWYRSDHILRSRLICSLQWSCKCFRFKLSPCHFCCTLLRRKTAYIFSVYCITTFVKKISLLCTKLFCVTYLKLNLTQESIKRHKTRTSICFMWYIQYIQCLQ